MSARKQGKRLSRAMETVFAGVLLVMLVISGCIGEEPGDVEEKGTWDHVPRLVVAGSDYVTGSAALVKMDEGQGFPATEPGHTLDSDPGGIDVSYEFDPPRAFVTGRAKDTIFVLNTVDAALLDSFTVGQGFWTANPQDVLVVSREKAYVTRQGNDDILVIDPEDGHRLGNITFTTPAGVEASPADMVMAGGTVFVALQNMHAGFGFGSTLMEKGELAVVDPAADIVVDTIELDRYNPVKLVYLADRHLVIASCAGRYTDAIYPDPGDYHPEESALEAVFASPPYTRTTLLTGEDPALDGNLYDLAVDHLYYAYVLVASGFANEDRLLKMDLITGEVDPGFRYPAVSTGNDDLAGLAISPGDFLAAGDRTNSEVVVFDLVSEAIIGNVDLALPPASLGVAEP